MGKYQQFVKNIFMLKEYTHTKNCFHMMMLRVKQISLYIFTNRINDLYLVLHKRPSEKRRVGSPVGPDGNLAGG